MWLRFVDGASRECGHDRRFWRGALPNCAAQGFTALLLIWDNASWHRSQAVRHWIRQHNQQVKRGAAGVRIVVCPLPSKSPWLNPIEPKWVHGKRAVSEPDRLLSADELEARVYAYYSCKGQNDSHPACRPIFETVIVPGMRWQCATFCQCDFTTATPAARYSQTGATVPGG